MADRFPRTPDSNAPLFDPGAQDGGWSLLDGGLLDDSHAIPGCDLTTSETLWIDAWDEFALDARAHRRAPQGLPVLGRLVA